MALVSVGSTAAQHSWLIELSLMTVVGMQQFLTGLKKVGRAGAEDVDAFLLDSHLSSKDSARAHDSCSADKQADQSFYRSKHFLVDKDD